MSHAEKLRTHPQTYCISTFVSSYSKAMLGLWGLFFLSLFIFNSLQYRLFLHSVSAISERFLVPAILAGFFLNTIRCGLQTRLVVANSLFAVLISLYSGEYYLAHRIERAQRHADSAAGISFDSRDKLTVIKDMRASQIEAYPVIRAENLLVPDLWGTLRPVLSSHGKPLLPMASIPDTEVVSCNESGQWQIYQADRHGFNNHDAQWDMKPVIGMVGDSFTHGSCVPREQNMATQLGEQFGGVINLGVGGFGPLLELAALTEYLKPLRPPTVLWVFFEGNDLTEDLPRESRSPLLLNYLRDDDFSQDLIHRPGEIKTALRGYLDRKLIKAMNRVDDPHENFLRYLSLDRLREAIGVGHVQMGYNHGDLDSELALFQEIIRKANQRVNSWGGRLYLVYLPESDRYLSKFGDSLIRRDIYLGVKEIASHEHISFIDVAGAFAHDPSPATLYAYPGAHFSPKGYHAAASTIAETLIANSTEVMGAAH